MSNSQENNAQLLGSFEQRYIETDKQLEIDIQGLGLGVHAKDNFFIKISPNDTVEWVVSRTCDHANGPLQLTQNSNKAVCPLHGWELDLDTLHYTNVAVQKQSLEFTRKDHRIFIDNRKLNLHVPNRWNFPDSKSVFVRHLSHACLQIQAGGLNIITDPWLLGPCFSNGWWHSIVPKADALEALYSADFIYISHNHPDHMHYETLETLLKHRPDMPILVPNFTSNSAENLIRHFGFTNVKALSFNLLYRLADSPVTVSMLKSGDFRDDSGLFISCGDFTCLLTVDSSSLNNYVLPTKVDLLATSFASGASSHPWCFEDYTIEERQESSTIRKSAAITNALKYIDVVQPRAYLPYAGFFYEAANRDRFIKANNTKNSLDTVRTHINESQPLVKFIDVSQHDLVEINTQSVIPQKAKEQGYLYSINESYIESYLAKELQLIDQYTPTLLSTYFINSQYQDNLIVYIQPTDNEFSPVSFGASVDFSNKKIMLQNFKNYADLYDDYIAELKSVRKLLIKIRLPALANIIINKLPWEEASIGFQCRFHRNPDVYNSNFWYYFSNIYIGSNVIL